VMISDGAGFNSFAAGSMYQGKWDSVKNCGTQVYNGPAWKQLAVQTYPLNTSKRPKGTNQQDPEVVYDPAKAWDREKGYDWLKVKYTDSAASATALSTGAKTFNNAINWSDLNQPIKPTLSELAKSLGRASGVITTVEWSHATPAGFSNAHLVERDQYQDIAQQMLTGGVLDVIMGAGNPDFDNNGQPWKPKKRDEKTEPEKSEGTPKVITGEVSEGREYKYVGGKAAWTAIKEARKTPDGLYQGYRPVSTKAEFEALCQGKVPAKVLGTAQAATTLQETRTKKDAKQPDEDTPLNENVPTLATMTRGALNVLNQNPNGFFLLIEGGAVDWANHSNLASRMVQEQVDFNLAVESVAQWVEANSSWEETLVIVTADHETGLLWGPNSKEEPFQPMVDNGPGKVPSLMYHSKGHSNSLVPAYARGLGAELLDTLIVGTDPVRGKYVDNTGIAKTAQRALGATEDLPKPPPPEPALQAKALTFNIRFSTKADGPNSWDLRREMVRTLLVREAADFIGLQEALPEQVAFVKESLPGYDVLVRSRETDAARGEAVPLFYRTDRWKLDPEQHGTFWLSETPDVPGSKSWQSSLPRVTTWARLTQVHGGQAVWVYNTHFDHRSEAARTEAAKLMARRIAARGNNEPVLVMGDFNAISSSPALKGFLGEPLQLVDIYMAAHSGEPEPGTFHDFAGKRDGKRIDYLLASPGNALRVVDASVLYDHQGERYASDHFPVAATIEWRPAKP
jgi:alkaline phosphatase